jgi:phosphoglycerol transferase MdoB-like AlkP superfamily enzyme
MRYVDNSLKRYFAALPDRTTVVLYGDHESGVGGYTSDGDRDRSIPWLFCIKEDGAIKQPHLHPDDLPANTELSQLDMATYLRKSLEATYQIADQKEANTINR